MAALLLVAGTGCITTVYQPLVSLQQPVVVDPQLPNFEGLRLLVRCVPGEHVNESDSTKLCRHLGTLFRNQGAEVDTEVPRGGFSGGADEEGRKHDLVVEVSARRIHHDDSVMMTIFSVLTLTLVPTGQEFTFAQDVVVRDSTGFLLARDSMQGRFIEYSGGGFYAIHWLLDKLVRPDEDEMTGQAPHRDFSRDYYGHLSQLVFNARVRSVVLKKFEN